MLIVAGARLRFKPTLVGRKGSAVGLCQQEYTIDDLRADSPLLLPHVSKCCLSQRPQLQLVWGATGANKVATRKIKKNSSLRAKHYAFLSEHPATFPTTVTAGTSSFHPPLATPDFPTSSNHARRPHKQGLRPQEGATGGL